MIIHNSYELSKYDKLNFYSACELLDIDLHNINETNITNKYIKKKYHELSLKYHPDKNNNSKFSNEYFQKIKESYDYLTNICSDNDTEDRNNNQNTYDDFVRTTQDETKNNTYNFILTTFINSILTTNFKKENYKETIVNIIKEIVINYEESITDKLFDNLDKETLLEIYQFLIKYKSTLHINDNMLTNIYDKIKDKYQDIRVFILNPTIDDLLDSNIYKLNIDDTIYPVPLWHNEIYFDSPEGEIIVINKPELPEHITIDDNNNLHIVLDNIIFDRNLIEGKTICFSLGKKIFEIECDKLFIKQGQYCILKNQGISKINENNIYNISLKSDIVVKIIFSLR